MGLKLYGSPMSTCTARVKTVLEELGLDYELIPINFATGEHKQPPHIFRNPFGQVPAFEDGDLTIFESRAITRYIASNYQSGGGPDLLKKSDAKAGAQVNVWIEVESHQFHPAISPIFYQFFIVPRFGGVPDQNIINENVEKLGKVLDVYEVWLSKNKYLAGDSISLADLHHIPYTFYLMATPHASLITSRPHVKAWWENISSRPACKKREREKMKLYGLGVEVDTARVMATLEEMAVDYHLITIDPEAGETKLPTYLSINPFGQIPALQDAHLTLFGSRATSKYIARKHKRMSKDLIRESNPEEGAMVEVWMGVEAETYEPAISALMNYVIEVDYFGNDEDEQVMAKKVGDLEKVLDVYEERLGKNRYLAGDFFSLADLHHLPHTHRLMSSPRLAFLMNSRPKVRAWWEDLSSRPSCKKVTQTMDACAIAWKENNKPLLNL